MGSVPIPDGLAPGASLEIDIPATAPASAGDWLAKGDIVLPGGAYLSDVGVVAIQLPLTTTIAP